MTSLSILYLGNDSGTSLQRARALERIGHRVFILNPRRYLADRGVVNSWLHHTGSLFAGEFIKRQVLDTLGRKEFDVVWVNGGELICPSLLENLRTRCKSIVSYINDDPFGKRDGLKWRLYLKSLPLYDLVTVVRDCNVSEARAAGAKNVLRVYMSADEIAHAPREITAADQAKWASEVLFIGTWMPERGPFLARLIELGAPLAIFGDNWRKAKEWNLLSRHWRGPGLYTAEDYAKAVQCAKVCLGLLSKGNRDLSTQRSFEIPHFGSVLCAERTPEHEVLYEENVESTFWNSPEECAQVSFRLLSADQWRKALASGGRKRCLQNQTTNEHVVNLILATALNAKQTHSAVLA